MNTHPKNNNEQGSGLLSHPEQVSGQGTAKRGSVYDQITERVVELLTQGTIPWQKPFNVKRGFPRNLVSKKAYRGINVFLLHAMHYESPFWLTYHQAQQLGAHIRKGEKACPVVFWKQLEIEDKESHEIEKVPMARFYYVFNISQCEGLGELPDPKPVASTSASTNPHHSGNLFDSSNPSIGHGMTTRREPIVPPEDFAKLQSSNTRNGFQSEAYVYRVGSLFPETGLPFMKSVFGQIRLKELKEDPKPVPPVLRQEKK
jgi:antirestriction protein ArdC